MPDLFWLPAGFFPVPVTAAAAILLVFAANRDKQIKAKPLQQTNVTPNAPPLEAVAPAASVSPNEVNREVPPAASTAAASPPVQSRPQPPLSADIANQQRWRRSISFTIRGDRPR